MATGKKKSSGGGGSSSSALRNVMASAVGTDALLDLVQKLGLVDLVVGRLKAKFEETDLDDLLDEITDYLKRNPEVLVASLATLTVATGLVVWLNARREWDGTERRNAGDDDDDSPRTTTRGTRVTSSTGRVRKAS